MLVLAMAGCASNTNAGKSDTEDNQQEAIVPAIDTAGLVRVEFTEDRTNIANPERGFYYPYSFSGSGAFGFYQSDFEAKRKQGHTIFLLEFWLKSFMDKDISKEYLESIQKVLDGCRKAGVKPILRFGYRSSFDVENEANNPRPWDPEQSIVLRHIEQLKPILQANGDIIHSMQAGFVGIWGEWYYTEHFVRDPKTDEDYEPRRKVLNALLDALPASRQIAVRTPEFKIRILRIDPKDTLTREQAYKETPKARIAGHNDCFVANENDYETFVRDYERPFWETDTKYTFMGGETCDASNKYSDCSNALKDLEAQHWSYLNIAYNRNVLSKWSSGKCLSEVQLRLGYRLVLHESFISPDITAGSTVRSVFRLSNDGWAAPINPRGLELIIENKDSGAKTVVPVSEENPRFWMPGEKREFELDFTAPEAGNYILYLNLPDPEPKLHDNPLFSIRLANKNSWQPSTGYNKITEFEVQ